MRHYISTALLFLLSGTAASTEQIIECPTKLASTSLQLTPSVSGWRYFAESPLYLHGATVLSGPPEQRGHLIHDAVHTSKEGMTYVYRLNGPFPAGKWVQCAYGEHHALTLSKQLDDATVSCTITYRKGSKAGQNDIRIVCNQL